eukprot:g14758.t1
MEAGHIKRMELHSAERGGVLAPLTLEHPNIRESSIGLYLPGGCTSQARRLALAHGDWEKAHGPLKGAQLGHLSRLQGYAPTEAQLKPYQESERISAENFVKFCEEVGYEERFETMRHSQLAQKQLEQLFVGRYAAPAEPGESMAESQARERVTLLGDEGCVLYLVTSLV